MPVEAAAERAAREMGLAKAAAAAAEGVVDAAATAEAAGGAAEKAMEEMAFLYGLVAEGAETEAGRGAGWAGII